VRSDHWVIFRQVTPLFPRRRFMLPSSPKSGGIASRPCCLQRYNNRVKDSSNVSAVMAPDLPNRMAPQEVKLWVHRRSLRSQGVHILRQVPNQRYIVGFARARRRLVIEVDGNQHGKALGLIGGATRDAILAGRACRVLGFFLKHGVDRMLPAVMETIFQALESRWESVE
jgi:very-short-patch-repair endonuclease